MQSVKKSVLVPHAAEQMFQLVDGIERYPEFLPWCSGATVLEKHEDGKTARVDIAYRGVRAHFTTHNVNRPPESIVISLEDGPFRDLYGEWRFTALDANACKIDIELCYEFASGLLGKVVGPVFSHIARSLVDAFVRRADVCYKSSTDE
jgi:ribosome-associated toxin RatA of RatAB toxin-antitoxin module